MFDPSPVRPRRTFWRFLIVGSANAAIDTAVYLLLTSLGLEIIVANLISTTCGLTFSFFANRSFTFRAVPAGRKDAIRQVVVFVLVVGFGLWVIQPIVIVGVGAFLTSLPWLATSVPAWLLRVVPKLVAIGVALVWNYLAFKWIVFKPRAASPEDRGTG